MDTSAYNITANPLTDYSDSGTYFLYNAPRLLSR